MWATTPRTEPPAKGSMTLSPSRVYQAYDSSHSTGSNTDVPLSLRLPGAKLGGS